MSSLINGRSLKSRIKPGTCESVDQCFTISAPVSLAPHAGREDPGGPWEARNIVMCLVGEAEVGGADRGKETEWSRCSESDSKED